MDHDHRLITAIAQVRRALEGNDFALEVLDDYEADHRAGRGDWQRLTGFFQGLSAAKAIPYEDYCEVSALVAPWPAPEPDHTGTPASRRAQLIEALDELENVRAEMKNCAAFDAAAFPAQLKRYEVAQVQVASAAQNMRRFGLLR